MLLEGSVAAFADTASASIERSTLSWLKSAQHPVIAGQKHVEGVARWDEAT